MEPNPIPLRLTFPNWIPSQCSQRRKKITLKNRKNSKKQKSELLLFLMTISRLEKEFQIIKDFVLFVIVNMLALLINKLFVLKKIVLKPFSYLERKKVKIIRTKQKRKKKNVSNQKRLKK